MAEYPIKVSPATSATSTWAIFSVCGAVPSGAVLCCAAWDGIMCNCKAVLQWTPYTPRQHRSAKQCKSKPG